MSQIKIGSVGFFKGKNLSDEHRRKLSESHKKSIASINAIKKAQDACRGVRNSIATEFKKGIIPKNFKGRIYHSLGYVWVHSPQHPFKDARNNVLEHRLVVERHIGRHLSREEVVHHVNETKDDNRPENLIAFSSKSAHVRFHKSPSNVRPDEIIFDGRNLHLKRILMAGGLN